MRASLIIIATVLSGCTALGDVQGTARECKVHSLEPAKVAGPYRESGLDQRRAVAALGTSDLRRSLLNRPMGATGTIEEALRDCN